MNLKTMIASAAFAIASLGATMAHAQDPAWFQDAAKQLADREKCKVTEYTDASEAGEGDNKMVSASVSCEDGRKIKVSRKGFAEFQFQTM